MHGLQVGPVCQPLEQVGAVAGDVRLHEEFVLVDQVQLRERGGEGDAGEGVPAGSGSRQASRIIS